MSRNLCRTDCRYCQGAIFLIEPWRPITRDDCGPYFDEYEGMPVAAAECEACEAKYLAWGWHGRRESTFEPAGTVCDLSFRSTFDDEPGADDLPKWDVRRVVTYERVGPWEGKL